MRLYVTLFVKLSDFFRLNLIFIFASMFNFKLLAENHSKSSDCSSWWYEDDSVGSILFIKLISSAYKTERHLIDDGKSFTKRRKVKVPGSNLVGPLDLLGQIQNKCFWTLLFVYVFLSMTVIIYNCFRQCYMLVTCLKEYYETHNRGPWINPKMSQFLGIKTRCYKFQ